MFDTLGNVLSSFFTKNKAESYKRGFYEGSKITQANKDFW